MMADSSRRRPVPQKRGSHITLEYIFMIVATNSGERQKSSELFGVSVE